MFDLNWDKNALGLEPDLVMAVDGDGGIIGTRICAFTEEAVNIEFDIIVGVRVNRIDPIYRKHVTSFVRILVFLKSRKMPKDGNTPIRIYRA